jgi:lysozyme
MRRLAIALGLGLVACSSGPEPTSEVTEANTTQCPMTVVEGVDVYDGQGTIDWTKVKAANRDFAFIKATQGDYNTQTTFTANWHGAKAAGVVRSAYHFFDPTIDGVKQAQHFSSVVSGAGGMAFGDLPPMLDIECPTSSTQASANANCEYTGNSGWVPTATLVTRVFDWLHTVEMATGKKAVIYSYPAWFGDVALTDARLAQYPLFIATLSSCASVPPPWTKAVFWQYSFTGTVSGIPGQVDMDRFFGTLAELVAYADGPVDAGADGAADAARAEAGADAGAADASPIESADSGDAGDGTVFANADAGCNCRASTSRSNAGWAVAAIAIAVVRRRRARR